MVNSDVFWHYFEEVEDPRVDRTKKHKLVDILFIAAAAVISGADSFVEIEMYGQRKYKWLRQFLELPNEYHHTIHSDGFLRQLKPSN